MQMAATPVDEAAVISRGAERARHVSGLDELGIGTVALIGHLCHVLADGLHMARPRRNLHPAVLQIAVDVVRLDAALDDVVTDVPDVAQEAFACVAELALDASLAADAADHLAAVAA